MLLEDRRVLYNPMQVEVREQVDYSVGLIRDACTEALQHLGEEEFGARPIRAIREACRRYHDDANLQFSNLDFPLRDVRDHDATPGFFMALGAFRASVGYHVAVLAAHYDFDIEGDLASVLPVFDDDRR